MTTERLMMLGRDHPLFGAVAARATTDGRCGVAISAGGDPTTVKWETKGDAGFPNEDACCAVDAGPRVLIAVADSHFGHRASHDLVIALAAADVPATPEQLDALVTALGALPPLADESETTLAVAVLDRASGAGFGVGFGDSTIATVGADGVEVWSTSASDYVSPGGTDSFREAGRRFALAVPEGAFLVAFTDGVDGCGGVGGASIGAAELRELRARSGRSAGDFARQLAELALVGVGGQAGGHDNVGVAVAGR